VSLPSRGGIDDYTPVLALLAGWFASRGLASRQLTDPTGRPVGVVCDVEGGTPGPRYVLDACADTAPFGDVEAWRHAPTSGVIEDGWLYGRGAGDSKAAVAIFAHLAARLQRQAAQLRGSLTVLFDVDEHSGGFGGAKAYFGDDGNTRDVAGVMIGYPGTDHLVVGGRGFLRARITCRGRSWQTGGVREDGSDNAAVKAARLITALAGHARPGPVDAVLKLPPRLTVTAVHAGQGYSVVPDRCEIDVDVRLTTDFGQAAAQALVERTVAAIDEQFPTGKASTLHFLESWPAYHLAEHSPLRVALLQAARHHLPIPPLPHVAGPSNIGNYLAKRGLDVTAGLGVGYRGLHAADERIDLSTIPLIQATYHEAVLALLAP
jgi:succinyl-diaminopimelate desuccinylase